MLLLVCGLLTDAASLEFRGSSRMKFICAPDINDYLEAGYNLNLHARVKNNAQISLLTFDVIWPEYFYNEPRQYNLGITHINVSVQTSLFRNSKQFWLRIGRPHSYTLNQYLYATGGYSGNSSTKTIRAENLLLGPFSARTFLTWKGDMYSPVYGIELAASSESTFGRFSFVNLSNKGHWTAPFPEKTEFSSLIEFSQKIPAGSIDGLFGSCEKNTTGSILKSTIKEAGINLSNFLGINLNVVYRDYDPLFDPTYRDRTPKRAFGYSWVADQKVRWNPVDQYYGQRGFYLSARSSIPGFGNANYGVQSYIEQDALRDYSFVERVNNIISFKLDGSYRRYRFSMRYNLKNQSTEDLVGARKSSEIGLYVWRSFIMGPASWEIHANYYKGNGIKKNLSGLGDTIAPGWESILDLKAITNIRIGKLQGSKFIGGFAIYDRTFGEDQGKLFYTYLGYEKTFKGGLEIKARIAFPNIDERNYQGLCLPYLGFYEPQETEVWGADTRVFDNCLTVSYRVSL